MDWIKKIVPTAGLLIGILFVAIGGVMTIGSTLEYVILEPDLSYIEDGCMYKFDVTAGKDIPLDEKAKEECIAKRTAQEITMQENNLKRNLIQGFSFLITGVFFWIFWNRKKHA
jgi:hypothetical protein